MTEIKNIECCPRFDPTPWDNKTHQWEEKLFIKDHVTTLFYVPMNFGKVMTRMNKKVENSRGKIPDYLCLADHTTKWNMDLYLAVDKEIYGAESTTLSGEFISKVYEGDFKDSGKWGNDFESYVKSEGKKMKKMYMWYTTCPQCAKKYGKNYVVFFAEV